MSKLGGSPDLEKDIEWPVDANNIPLSFVGQINLAEASKFDVDGLLPKTGLLSFFFCQEQDYFEEYEKQRLQFKVIYQENTDRVEHRQFPESVDESCRFVPTKMEFSKGVSLPTYVHPFTEKLNLESEEEGFLSVMTDADRCKILGYADEIQQSMELECALMEIEVPYKPGIDYDEPLIKEAVSRQFDWILLFQVTSEVAGMMWGDVGDLYFWIKKQDLINKDFSKCWRILQCT